MTTNSVKQGGLKQRDPVVAASCHSQSSLEESSLPVKSLRAGGEVDSVEHQECTRRAGHEAQKLRIKEEKALFVAQMNAALKRVQKRLERIGSDKMGSWLTVAPERHSNTLLSVEEMQDNLHLRYGMWLVCLLDRCEGCGKGFSVDHALKCKKSGLVCIRHNDVRDVAC